MKTQLCTATIVKLIRVGVVFIMRLMGVTLADKSDYPTM
jgi:hypothetical protein